jgi:uncharacterized membrane protein
MSLDGEAETSIEVTSWLTLDSFTTNDSPVSRQVTRRPQDLLRAAFQRKHWAFIALVVLYIVWFSYLSWKLYYGYGYPPFDLAIFDQGLWLLTHFHIPFVTVMGRNLFGDHTQFILLLFAPFYRLFPEPQGLLMLQVLAIAGASIPIYLLAQKLIRNTVIATLLVAAYLMNPALEQGNMQQFHPEALQVLIISIAIYAAVESRGALLAVMVVFALMVKEDAALIVIPLGLWVFWRRDRKWGTWIIAGAVAWTAFALEVIIPSLLGSGSLYASDIPFGGVGGFFKTLFAHPGTMISYLRSGTKPFYVWQMGFTTGWGFIVAPEIALIGILVLAENVVSDLPYMQQIPYQFSMPLVPILILGTVWAISRQRSILRRNVITGITVICAFWSCVLWGFAPFSNQTAVSVWPPNGAIVHSYTKLENMIPPNAVVAAQYLFVAHLDHRTGIYLWPTPFETGNYGLFNTNGQRLPVASTVQYLLLQVPITTSEDLGTFDKIKPYFKMIASENGAGLYERVKK